MRIISPKMLRVFRRKHPLAREPLEAWRKRAKGANWESFDEVKLDFGKAVDRYGKYLIFDIGGNKYRLIAVPHYNTGCLFIRHVLTHAEYDLEKWKE